MGDGEQVHVPAGQEGILEDGGKRLQVHLGAAAQVSVCERGRGLYSPLLGLGRLAALTHNPAVLRGKLCGPQSGPAGQE